MLYYFEKVCWSIHGQALKHCSQQSLTHLHLVRSLNTPTGTISGWKKYGLKIKPEEPASCLLRKSEPSGVAVLTKCALWLLPEGTAGQTDHGASPCAEGKILFSEATVYPHTSSRMDPCPLARAVSSGRVPFLGTTSSPCPGCPVRGVATPLPCCPHLCPGFLLLYPPTPFFLLSNVKGVWLAPPLLRKKGN